MANNRCIYQQKETVSIPKSELMEWVIMNDNLNKKDLRVCLFLLTELDGWKEPIKGSHNDPKNYKMIDKNQIADILDMNVKDIKKSIKTLLYYEILEKGDSNSGIDGYRFTF